MKKFLKCSRGQKGFTLIELLIVIAILGVLAAVIIPNVSRFMGAGKEEAAKTELANVQTAVISMMVDNDLSKLDYPVSGNATNDMTKFPEDPSGTPQGQWVLYGCITADGDTANYVAANTTAQFYTVDAAGTVTQLLPPP